MTNLPLIKPPRPPAPFLGSLRAAIRGREEGQSLVEFALVFPIFVGLLMGIIEFAFVFNALLGMNFASRDAALAAAEAGNSGDADCVVLKAIDDAVGAPASDSQIQTVEIYRASPAGVQQGAATTYARGGSMTCNFIDGTSITLAYNQTTNGYPSANRCNVLAGCAGSATVHNVGVRITYTHLWVTPLRNFIGGGTGSLTFDRSSVMRMEPIL